MSILVFNAGSSSLKFEVFNDEADESLGAGIVDWAAGRQSANIHAKSSAGAHWNSTAQADDMRNAVSHALTALVKTQILTAGYDEVRAVGHRVVHGGREFQNPVVIDEKVRNAIQGLIDLAPLHNPAAVETVVAAQRALPGVPHVAAFDTTFFAKLPERAHVYPGPYQWFSEWGIRRFGFHGISHEYCALRTAEMLGNSARRMVICHLGHGCSATAVRDGKAVDTTMGFTPLEGLMMGTRTGSIDPGILIHLQERHGFSPGRLDQALNKESGLLGVSGVSADFRKVEAAAGQGNERARLALEIYADRIRAAIGALSTRLAGIDALVFTAGVGENAPSMRDAVCEQLEYLGIEIDDEKNFRCQPDQDISLSKAACRILVLRTREALMIARVTRNIVTQC